jgi:DNA-binding CsgD family transcriptional regulator
MHAVAACPGLLVVDTALKVVASNQEAIQMLAFPDQPENTRHLDRWLSNRIRNQLVDGQSPRSAKFLTEIRSGKRTYVCRSFSLSAEAEGHASAHPVLVIILERKANHTTSMAELCERFSLTAREQETVQLLLQGLTSKEIGQRMGISPNTVKAFIRLVMVKMKVSTRSGIIGKIVGPKA